jgi:adenylate kinase family enzyme
MKPIVIGFSGRQATGKTTLSAEVASRLAWPRVSFGDYVRAVARSRGMPDSAVDLQEVGARLIEELGWEGFCRTVIAQADWALGQPLVVDGIRHAEALTTLRQLVHPTGLLHVHIMVSDLERRARLVLREQARTHPVAERSEAHSTEIQVVTVLPGIADLVVDGVQPTEENVRQVLSRVHRT